MLFICSLWPELVRQRIKDTYMYFGGSLLFTAGSAVAISRNAMLMSYMSRGSLVVSYCIISKSM